MKRLIRNTLVLAMVGGAATFTASPAKAACHDFTFAQATYSVDEAGGQVTIGVRRDAALNPSSVRTEPQMSMQRPTRITNRS